MAVGLKEHSSVVLGISCVSQNCLSTAAAIMIFHGDIVVITQRVTASMLAVENLVCDEMVSVFWTLIVFRFSILIAVQHRVGSRELSILNQAIHVVATMVAVGAWGRMF